MKNEKTVKDLQEQRDALQLRLEIDHLSRSLMPEGLLESWGDIVDRSESRWSSPNNSGADLRTSVGYDRRDGDNTPFWVTEMEHAEQRGIGRYLAQQDETVIGALDTMADYVVGSNGGIVAVESKTKDDNGPLCKYAERVWQSWVDEHRFDGEMEREIFIRGCSDGERAIWLEPRKQSKVPGFVLVEPEWITEPDPRSAATIEEHYNLPDCNWKYGVARSIGWSEKFVGLFAERYGDQGDWEFLPHGELIWDTRNVVRRVKRGGSDLFAIYKIVEAAAKLVTNTVSGAQIQACIAYIREHASGVTRDGITGAAPADYTFTRNTPKGGSVTQKARRMLPGTVLDVSNGLKYHAGPVGAGSGVGFLDIAQGALRRAGVRWGMPEYMISGDASNANYSSTLVAGTPFVRRMQTRQYVESERRRELAWKVLAHAANHGVFAQFGVYDAQDLRDRVDIDVSFPEIAGIDQAAEAARDSSDLQSGVVSAQTIAEKRGYDWEQERQRGAGRQADRFGSLSPPIDQAIGQPEQSPIESPVAKPVGVDGALDGELGVVGGELVKPQDTALNGAQIKAATEIVQNVADGKMPRDAAQAQLVTLFNLTPDEADSILGSAGKGFVPKKDDQPTAKQVTEALTSAIRESFSHYP